MDQTPGWNEQAGAATVAALFDKDADAERAITALIDGGIDRAAILKTARVGRGSGPAESDHDASLWHAIKSLFVGEDDRHVYTEGVRRGGTLLTVRAHPEQADRTIAILERFDPIDLDTRASEWRQQGWNADGTPGFGHTDMSATDSSMGSATPVESRSYTSHRETDPAGGSFRVRRYSVVRPLPKE